MAVLLLRDVELPRESFGHLLLGGPGPILMYRIGRRHARVCIDVSLDAMSRAEGAAGLWPLYCNFFPAPLREPVAREFLAGRVTFMSNQLVPRTWYGRPGCVMIGDAVGYFHPITAMGMTLAVEDAACLARCADFVQFRTQRVGQSKVAVLLATALYEIFSVRSEAASACRSAIFQLWRESPAERVRTMDLLSGTDTNLWSLYRSAAKVFGMALGDVFASAARHRRWNSTLAAAQEISHLANWLLYSAVPERMRSRLSSGRATPFESRSNRRNRSSGNFVQRPT